MSDPELQKIINARKILILDYPFWGSLVLRLRLQESNLPYIGWTNGKSIGWNRERVAPLTLPETVGWLAHEVAHCVFQHPLRRNGRHKKRWNVAGDYVINSILLKEKFMLPGRSRANSHFDGMSTDEVYQILDQYAAVQKLKELAQCNRGDNDDKNKGEENDSNESNSPDNSSDLSDGTMDDQQDSNEDGMDGDSSPDGNSDEEDRDLDDNNLDGKNNQNLDDRRLK